MSSTTVKFTGPVYLGNSLSWGLFGILVIQSYHFFVTFPRERVVLKCLVAILLLIQILHTMFLTIFTWDMLVTGWGNPAALLTIPWSGLPQPILTGITSGIVQIYYAWRIWTLKGSSRFAQVVPVFIVLIALMQSLTAVIAGTMFCFAKDVADMVKLTSAVEVWLGGAFACDVIISASMAIVLSRARRNSHFKETNDLIKKLIINAIETGAITAVTAGLDLALFLIYPDTNLHLCPSLLLSKLYSITVLTSLNGRRGGHSKGNHLPMTTDSLQMSTVKKDTQHTLGAVHVSTDMRVDVDEFPRKSRRDDF